MEYLSQILETDVAIAIVFFASFFFFPGMKSSLTQRSSTHIEFTKICLALKLERLNITLGNISSFATRSPSLGACNSHKISQCNGIFTDQSIFIYLSREIGQFQSTWARFVEDKIMRSHVKVSTSFRQVDINPCLWLQLVTEVPVRIWIRDKFKLKIDRSVKTSWQEYGIVAGS